MTPDEGHRRVARLEAAAGITGPLGQSEAAELRALEAELARFGPIDSMDHLELDQFASWHASDDAARLGQLRHRALSREEQAERRAARIALEAMDLDRLDEFMVEMATAQEPPP